MKQAETYNAVGSLLSGFSALATTFIVLISACIGLASFNSWQDQQRYLEDRRLAIETLVAYDRGFRAIEKARSRAILNDDLTELGFLSFNIGDASGMLHLNFPNSSSEVFLATLAGKPLNTDDEVWDDIERLIPITLAVYDDESISLNLTELAAVGRLIQPRIQWTAQSLDDKNGDENTKKINQWDQEREKAYSDIAEKRQSMRTTLVPYIRSPEK